jgi:hypothetical protein
MNPGQALREEHSKQRTSELVEWVGDDAGRFAEIVDLMTGGDPLLEQRAAWVVGHCGEQRPALVPPELPRLLDNLDRSGLHDAVVRATFRILQFAEIPPPMEGRVCGLAMAALGGAVPVAVKAYAMTVLRRLVDRYPEIEEEVKLLIGEQLPDAKPGFRARARIEFGMG